MTNPEADNVSVQSCYFAIENVLVGKDIFAFNESIQINKDRYKATAL